MSPKQLFIGLGAILVLGVGGYLAFSPTPTTSVPPADQTAILPPAGAPETITISGTYTCLPLQDDSESKTDCAFGLKADSGEYYAVNFGASAGSMADFNKGAHIVAKGFIITRENLHPDNWKKFSMIGLFTVTEKPTVR
jgi:hypothetical protein